MNLDERKDFFIPHTPLSPIHVKRSTSALIISSCFFTGNLEMPGYHSYSWHVFWNTISVSSQQHLSSTNLNQIPPKKKCICILPSLRKFSLLSFSILKKRMLMFYPDIKSHDTGRNYEWAALHDQFFMLFSSLSFPLSLLFFFPLVWGGREGERGREGTPPQNRKILKNTIVKSQAPPAHKTNIWFEYYKLCNCTQL